MNKTANPIPSKESVDDARTLAQAAGIYQEQPVAGPLAAHFTRVWLHYMTGSGAASVVVVPDGCVDLIWADGALRVAGPDRGFQAETLASGSTIIGFRFQPGLAASWLGLPLSELVNQRPPLAEFWGREAERLADVLSEARSPADAAALFASALRRRVPEVSPAESAVHAAYQMLRADRHRGEPLVPRLVAELGTSERSVRRHFADFLGYGPKTLDRILRFQRFLRLVRAGHRQSLAHLAVAAGYADQAHLTRESRRLSAFTPDEIVRMTWTTSGPDAAGHTRHGPPEQ